LCAAGPRKSDGYRATKEAVVRGDLTRLSRAPPRHEIDAVVALGRGIAVAERRPTTTDRLPACLTEIKDIAPPRGVWHKRPLLVPLSA